MAKKKKRSNNIKKKRNNNINKKRSNVYENEKSFKTTLKENLKERFLIVLFLNLSLIFTVFIFSPMDIFLRNQKDFGIGFFDVLLPLSISGLLIFIIISAIMIFVKEKTFKILSALTFGLLAAFYIQMLFFNGDMAAITGDTIDYAEGTISNYINIFIFLFILFLPLIFIMLKKLFPENKIINFGKGKMIIYLSSLIFVMQFCGIVQTIFYIGLNNIDMGRRNLDYKLSYENLLNLSEDGNIVVFLVDRLDGVWFDDFLEKYPEMKNELLGFTYYRNNVACYTNTFPSIPEMLTGFEYVYEENNIDAYLKEAWNSYSLADILHENSYDVNLLIDKSTTYSDVDDLFGKADNLKVTNENFEINYIGENGILEIMLKMSLGKLAPYYSKNYFLDGIEPNFSNNFITYGKALISTSNGGEGDIVDDNVGIDSDLKFYDYIKNHDMNSDNKNKTFSFIHLNGAHSSSEEISKLYQDSPLTTDVYKAQNRGEYSNSTIRGEFEIIFEYIEKMKQLKIYDNSTIIILGDHGHPPYEIEWDGADALSEPIITALMIKPQNSDEVPIKTNDDAELSNANFIKSILDIANIESDNYGNSYYDIIDNNLSTTRKVNIFNIKTPVCEYKVTGNARDFNNWKHFDVK